VTDYGGSVTSPCNLLTPASPATPAMYSVYLSNGEAIHGVNGGDRDLIGQMMGKPGSAAIIRGAGDVEYLVNASQVVYIKTI
jgi:hypothetical protein